MKRKTVDRDSMSEILADLGPEAPVEKEKGIVAPQVVNGPKPIGLQKPQPSSLTLPAPPVRAWFSKIAVVCLVGFVLGLLGLQPNVERRVESSYNSISAAIKKILVPTSGRVSTNSASSIDSNISSTSPKLSVEDTEKSSLGR
jgi:hypothetical protein